MDPVSRSSLLVARVSETFRRQTVPILVPDVRHTVCRFLVFRGKPAGRLALFRYLSSWFSIGYKALDIWDAPNNGSPGEFASCSFLFIPGIPFLAWPWTALCVARLGAKIARWLWPVVYFQSKSRRSKCFAYVILACACSLYPKCGGILGGILFIMS